MGVGGDPKPPPQTHAPLPLPLPPLFSFLPRFRRGGWRDVYVCRTLDDLLTHYNDSGQLTMVVQEFIEWDHFVRCLALGRREVLPMKYDPRGRRYVVEHAHLSPELGRRIVEDSLTLMRALGYDMCSLEWAIKDGVPYAIDFMNPAPDMDLYSLTPHYFEWA